MATQPLRITPQTLKVLSLMVEHHPEPQSGADIFNQTKMFSGTLYPILSRLETRGFLNGAWEDVAPAELGRPRRRFYRLTAEGVQLAKRELGALPDGATRRRPPWT